MSEEDYARRKALEQPLHKLPGIREKLCFDKRQAKSQWRRWQWRNRIHAA